MHRKGVAVVTYMALNPGMPNFIGETTMPMNKPYRFVGKKGKKPRKK
jgi:hypothetical protein